MLRLIFLRVYSRKNTLLITVYITYYIYYLCILRILLIITDENDSIHFYIKKRNIYYVYIIYYTESNPSLLYYNFLKTCWLLRRIQNICPGLSLQLIVLIVFSFPFLPPLVIRPKILYMYTYYVYIVHNTILSGFVLKKGMELIKHLSLGYVFQY